jgi:anti-sigma B factor antagonist
MALNMSKRQVDGSTVIVDLNGRMTLREGSAVLGNLIRDLVSKGNVNVLLNFAQVTYVDSSGIGELVRAHVNVRKQGGRLALYNVNSNIRGVLDVTNLLGVLDLKGDEAATLKGLPLVSLSKLQLKE